MGYFFRSSLILVFICSFSSSFSLAEGDQCRLSFDEGVSPELLAALQKRSFETDQTREAKLARQQKNNIARSGILGASINREILVKHTDTYTHEIKTGIPFDQKQTGTCWITAGQQGVKTVLVNSGVMAPDQNFSKNYHYYLALFDSANLALTRAMSATQAVTPAVQNKEFRRALGLISDGGYYTHFSYLVRKYGLVFEETMPETASSANSAAMLEVLSEKMAEISQRMIEVSKEGDPNTVAERLQAERERGLKYAWDFLEATLGRLPTHVDVSLEFIKAAEQAQKRGWKNVRGQKAEKTSKRVPSVRMTPKQLAAVIDYPHHEHIMVASLPGLKEGQTYVVNGTGIATRDSNGNSSSSVQFLNVSRERLIELIGKSVKSGNPVWIGLEMNRKAANDAGIMHEDLYDTNLGIETAETTYRPLTREERRAMFGLIANHAMLATAVDQPNPQAPPVKIKLLNTWGEDANDNGSTHAYYTWALKHFEQAGIPVKALSEAERKAILEGEVEVIGPKVFEGLRGGLFGGFAR